MGSGVFLLDASLLAGPGSFHCNRSKPLPGAVGAVRPRWGLRAAPGLNPAQRHQARPRLVCPPVAENSSQQLHHHRQCGVRGSLNVLYSACPPLVCAALLSQHLWLFMGKRELEQLNQWAGLLNCSYFICVSVTGSVLRLKTEPEWTQSRETQSGPQKVAPCRYVIL